ncbi:MAG: methyltransferase domain-containing protein [Geminicoccaceae bacterium]
MLGHAPEEMRRLARQAALAAAETEAFFRGAGITAGMHVLDIGSGAGDVALLAARLVPPNGSVHGIERSEGALRIATARAQAAGVAPVRFEAADLDTFRPTRTYDALTGRFVLPYLADPPATLRRLAAHLRPGGVVALMEFDTTKMESVPEAPLLRTVATWITEAFRGSGVDPALGSRLTGVFRAAGLPWPYLVAFQKSCAGPDGFYWWIAELVRTLLPHIVEQGLATEAEVQPDTLAARLQEEAIEHRATIYAPRWVGAWTRIPPEGLATR